MDQSHILAEEHVRGRKTHTVQIRETEMGIALRIQEQRRGEPRYLTIPADDIEELRIAVNRLADYHQQLNSPQL